MRVQQQIVQAFEETGICDQVGIMVDEAPVTQSWAEQIGADGYAEDAISAVTLAKELIEKIKGV